MNWQPERLDDELERMRQRTQKARPDDRPTAGDSEIRTLSALAKSVRRSPSLQVAPDFADHLERRLLAHRGSRQRTAHHWWGPLLPGPIHAHPLRAGALSLCLVLILLGTGILVVAAQVTNPTNPLYALKHWEQEAQVSLSGSPADQAQLDLQAARDQLNALPALADPSQAGAYRHVLAAFAQQVETAAQEIAALPAGPDHTRLAGALTTLQTDARHLLRWLLLQVAVPERQATTDELGQLGETVPHLTQVEVTLPAHSNGQASISIRGDGLQAGARLLVDGKPVRASGALQDGSYRFTTDWKGEQHPHSIGILNPDGTVAQTTAITLHASSENGGDGGGNGNNGNGNNGNGNGNSGNGGGKPGSTPIP